MRRHALDSALLSGALVGLFASVSAGQVSVPTRQVDYVGNTADARIASDGSVGYGSISYTYRIGAVEVTNTQYAAFLNAVARDDVYSLYSTDMASPPGGILRHGSPGSFSYTVIDGRGSLPVNFVSFWDACRFANWLHNGQPEGSQSPLTTESGVYNLSLPSMAANTVGRNPSWRWAVASDDEWYKAAYFQPFHLGGPPSNYWLYPTSSDFAPSTAQANYGNSVIRPLLAVGSFLPNFLGAYDMAGNVWEWTDSVYFGLQRSVRGGSFVFDLEYTLRADYRYGLQPELQYQNVGFRVVQSAILPCPADFDQSGFVDSDDFILYVYAFARGCTGPGAPLPSCFASADFDRSGFIDSDDFISYYVAFVDACGG